MDHVVRRHKVVFSGARGKPRQGSTAPVVQYSMTSTVLNRGGSKRERILDVAEVAVLAKGFAATSIEEIITAVGITKSGFFYHFPDKSDLAKALLQRYIDQ